MHGSFHPYHSQRYEEERRILRHLKVSTTNVVACFVRTTLHAGRDMHDEGWSRTVRRVGLEVMIDRREIKSGRNIPA